MRIVILNYCIVMGILLGLAGAWVVVGYLQVSEWWIVALVLFVGVPILAAWMIILDKVRDLIREEEEAVKARRLEAAQAESRKSDSSESSDS